MDEMQKEEVAQLLAENQHLKRVTSSPYDKR